MESMKNNIKKKIIHIVLSERVYFDIFSSLSYSLDKNIFNKMTRFFNLKQFTLFVVACPDQRYYRNYQ